MKKTNRAAQKHDSVFRAETLRTQTKIQEEVKHLSPESRQDSKFQYHPSESPKKITTLVTSVLDKRHVCYNEIDSFHKASKQGAELFHGSKTVAKGLKGVMMSSKKRCQSLGGGIKSTVISSKNGIQNVFSRNQNSFKNNKLSKSSDFEESQNKLLRSDTKIPEESMVSYPSSTSFVSIPPSTVLPPCHDVINKPRIFYFSVFAGMLFLAVIIRTIKRTKKRKEKIMTLEVESELYQCRCLKCHQQFYVNTNFPLDNSDGTDYFLKKGMIGEVIKIVSPRKGIIRFDIHIESEYQYSLQAQKVRFEYNKIKAEDQPILNLIPIL